MAPNDVLTPKHKTMHVELLKPGQTATFRLIGAGEIDPIRERPRFKSSMCLPGTEQVWDPEAEEEVTIGNVSHMRTVKLPTGESRKEPVVDAVWWDGSNQITCTYRKNWLYQYLMRSNYNADNPFRAVEKKPLFYLMSSDNKEKQDLQEELIKDTLKAFLRKGNLPELKTIAKQVCGRDSGTIHQLRAQLASRAGDGKEVKKIIFSLDPAKPEAKELRVMWYIYEAQKTYIIRFNNETGEVFWNNEARVPILKVGREDDPMTAMLEYAYKSKWLEELVPVLEKEESLENIGKMKRTQSGDNKKAS